MKKIAIFSILFASFAIIVDAAPVQRRGGPAGGAPTAGTPATSAGGAPAAPVTAARAGVRTGAQGGAPAQGAPTVAARSGATPVAAPAPGVSSARAATTGPTAPKASVMQSGTNVAAATTNTVVNEECRVKYYGCMDSFCMVDNDNGARCTCSDKKNDLEKILVDLEKLDKQARDMATRGVERIEMGANADAIIAEAKRVAAESMVEEKSSTTARRRATVDLAIFDTPTFFGDEITEGPDVLDSLKGKSGDALHSGVRDICVAQIKTECAKDLQMLQMMYANAIQGDCRAFENALKTRKNDSEKKLAAAEQALRAAALESFENQNKWDLGQCTVEFKKCMQTTGGCKDDFTGCVGIFAAEAAKAGVGVTSRTQTKDIMGSATKISVAASTYDTVLSKRPLCESVTKNCMAAVEKDKDAVWNAFLREVAPTLKSAELVAESNRRQNCIGNISECFQKGCKDTIDPKDPEGSFDMCLTRPAAMINICKVQLDECGIPTGSAALAEKHEIWGFVVQRLATMRVDSCTKAIKGCLQDEDRCGDNYIKCAGLTPEIVLKMCPADKMMVSCSGQTINGETITRENVQDKVEEIIYALMNNIRNESFDQCQALAEAKMEEVCGSTTRCDKIFEDSEFGTGGLQLTRESDAMSIIGIVNFGGFKITPTSSCCSTAGSCTPMTAGGSCASPSVERYTGITLTEPVCPTGKTCNHLDATKQSVKEIEAKAQRFINYLLNDTNIGYCMNGREVRGVGKSEAQFPTILNPFISSIIDDAKARAQQNYTAKYDRLLKEAEAKAAELGAKKASNGLCYDADVMSTMKEDKKDAE